MQLNAAMQCHFFVLSPSSPAWCTVTSLGQGLVSSTRLPSIRADTEHLTSTSLVSRHSLLLGWHSFHQPQLKNSPLLPVPPIAFGFSFAKKQACESSSAADRKLSAHEAFLKLLGRASSCTACLGPCLWLLHHPPRLLQAGTLVLLHKTWRNKQESPVGPRNKSASTHPG